MPDLIQFDYSEQYCFIQQDSHWVEDKQLFIKRNQELLDKVCSQVLCVHSER